MPLWCVKRCWSLLRAGVDCDKIKENGREMASTYKVDSNLEQGGVCIK